MPKDEVSDKDPYRTACTGCTFTMVLLGKGDSEVGDVSLRVKHRALQIVPHSGRVRFTQAAVAAQTQFSPGTRATFQKIGERR